MKKVSSVFWGIIVIVVGIIFLLNTLDITNFDIFFDGWWTLFIIIPSVNGLIKGEWTSSTLGLAIGVLLLLASRNVIEWNMVGKLFIAILLIVIGLTIALKPKTRVRKSAKGQDEYIGIFSKNVQKIEDKFEGTDVVSVFGGVDLDLRDAKITKDIEIDCVTVFGNVNLILPDGKRIKTSGVPIFGGLENRYKSDNGNTITIDYVCIFGEINIK